MLMINRLLKQLILLFDRDLKNKLVQKNGIKIVLKKLNNRKHFILQRIADTKGSRSIVRELSIIQAQRKKGIMLIKKMKNEFQLIQDKIA
jgi:predicted lactoylglutathione lyase